MQGGSGQLSRQELSRNLLCSNERKQWFVMYVDCLPRDVVLSSA